MNEEASKYLERGQRALAAAASLLRDGYPADAASKAYYAMFYAAQAALCAKDIHVVKHSAVESFFGQHFAKTGSIDANFHKFLIRARKLRESADYSLEEEVSEEVARQTLENGTAFVNAVQSLLAS